MKPAFFVSKKHYTSLRPTDLTAIVFSVITFVYYAGVFVFGSVLRRFED